ncbi:hypothetical protein NT6N_24130 [Oceaniferula spumae]|uniref:MmcQ/YjbR family DNA-binding protein n=1 Tax=Oceaniferula spumae TaxID=2979115 RepID=A0AAT9FN18_9BACT
MLVTYYLPFSHADDVFRQLQSCGIDVIRKGGIFHKSADFSAVFGINHNSQMYELTILRPVNEQDDLDCWLLPERSFDPLNPLGWIRWVFVERYQLLDLECLLADKISLTKE